MIYVQRKSFPKLDSDLFSSCLYQNWKYFLIFFTAFTILFVSIFFLNFKFLWINFFQSFRSRLQIRMWSKPDQFCRIRLTVWTFKIQRWKIQFNANSASHLSKATCFENIIKRLAEQKVKDLDPNPDHSIRHCKT